MQGSMQEYLAGVLKNRRGHNRRLYALMLLALFVVSGVAWQLRLVGVTLTEDTFCGYEEHIHDETCEGAPVLLCQECLDPHVHTPEAGCYETQSTLNCELEVHTHRDACYTWALICAEAHEHVGTCYQASFDCEILEHDHGESCYTVEQSLICPLEEGAVHEHTDPCWETVYVCEMEEHVHEPDCYSDFSAVESETGWMASLPQTLTGYWGEDLLSVAESQLGYRESSRNFLTDGSGIRHGYTRYGDWWWDGWEYEDWNGMFLSFCMYYAGIPETRIPYAASYGEWAELLKKQDLSLRDGSYFPDCGDIAAILPAQSDAAVLSIVESWDDDVLTVIQGDVEGQVRRVKYDMTVTQLLGYLSLSDTGAPQRPAEPTETTVSTEPTDTTEPTETTVSTEATDTTEPTETTVSTEATDTTEPTETTVSTEATDTTEPTETTVSTEAADTTEPTDADVSTQPPEVPELTEEERRQVEDMILTIDGLPDAAEIDAELARLLEADDLAGYRAYRGKMVSAVQVCFDMFASLSGPQQDAVTNAGRLMDYRYLLELPLVGQEFSAESVDGSVAAQVTADGVMPEDAVFSVEPLADDGEAAGMIGAALAELGSELLGLELLEMHFTDAQGNPLQPGCEVDVTLSFASAILQGEGDVFVYHITPDGAVDVTRAVMRDENGVSQVTFRTDGFSEYGIALAAASVTLTVNAINTHTGTNNAVMLYHKSGGGAIKDFNGMLYTWSDVIVVEPVNGVLTVTEVHPSKSGTNKQSVYASGSGFILVRNGSIAASVGDTVTVSGTFWNTDSGKAYNASGYGTVTFTSSAPNYPRPDKNNNVGTVASADTSEIINVNLWNYDSNINDKWRSDPNYPGFQYPGGAQTGGVSRWNMAYGDNIVADTADNIWINVTGADAPGGAINGNGKDLIEGAVGKNLGADGFPVLAYNSSSLSWLFSSGSYAAKQNSANINGLFRYNPENGEYFYDSRVNHAQYANNEFILYDAWLTSNFIMYPFGNFLPFNDINTQTTHASEVDSQWFRDVAAHAQYKYNTTSDERYATLAQAMRDAADEMDGWYPSGWGAEQLVRKYFELEGLQDADKPVGVLPNIYSIDYDIPTDFFFGMDMNMTFMQPKNGVTGPNNDYDMVFRFVGDDDVWVFIDGSLFLDLTGIHRHKGGTIDFKNGIVSYYDLDPATGDISTTPTKSYTFAQLLNAAGKDASVLNDKGTFKDYTTHSFKFYFMERGSGSSVCKMNFNFPLLRQNSITVAKELSVDEPEKLDLLGNPDFKFQVWKENGTELFVLPDTTFEILDANDNHLGYGITDADGIFTLKAGQKAVFGGIKENEGRYFVRELLDPDAFAQYGEITINGSSQTTGTGTDVTIGSDTFKGVDSPVKDVSDGSTIFHFNNQITFKKLGRLEIGKKLISYNPATENLQFNFHVTLDGAPIPVGTVYKVGQEERQVATEGIITLAPGEKALIEQIVSGSQFTVQETEASAKGYTVVYAGENLTQGTNENGPCVSGTIKTNATVSVLVTNSENGTDLDIPVTKTLTNPNDKEHVYTFCLEQVTDSSGKTPVEGGTKLEDSIAITGESAVKDLFRLVWLEKDMEALPATFFYKITEKPDPDNPNVRYDEAVYVVEVTVDKSEEEGLKAAISGIRKNGEAGEAIVFQNTLLGALSIGKEVAGSGSDPDQEFTFTVKLIPGTFPTLKNDVPGTLTFDEQGCAQITLKHGETLTIREIPLGTQWTVTEESAPGYHTSIQYEGGSKHGTEIGGTLSANTAVTYINTAGVELPSTGGIGTEAYMSSGMGLMSAAGLLMYSKKRKNRKGAK